MTSQYGNSGGNPSGYRYGSASNYNNDGAASSADRGRRKKLAAMAGSLYRAGAAAASEIKEQYNNTRIRNLEPLDHQQISIPGSFPQVSIIHKGEEQMVLFPSYAKRHVRIYGDKGSGQSFDPSQGGSASLNDSEYWRHEWAKAEDEKAIVDVDVRGWIYMPSRGPMTRRNRMLLGLARRLSGIPAPTVQAELFPASAHDEHERMREEKRIAQEAEEIERRGQGEREVANRGGYSEKPRDDDSDSEPASATPASPSGSPPLIARPSFHAAELSNAELATANANLMARIGPFMTTPLVNLPITVFFYNDEESQSRTVETNDSGHFIIRAPLDFVPTHVRVLVNEDISATQPVQVIEPKGISLISDIDDTIKRSNISLGAREIFRNTFIRELADLTIEGVKEWYNSLHDMGIKVHYCSNSPWQLFPVLWTFLHTAGLPQGSIHLKQYSGMLQGIFEPVAERKKGTLEKILRDFPERKFLLVGDSGEADLEVYTDLVVANPGRILAVFIRDVTTPNHTGYFDTGFSLDQSRRNTKNRFDEQQQQQPERSASRPELPPRNASAPSRQQQQQGPVMGTLIDLSDEPDQISPTEVRRPSPAGSGISAVDLLAFKKAPPPRPVKPMALRSSSSEGGLAGGDKTNAESGKRNPSGGSGSPHPLTQMQNLSQNSISRTNAAGGSRAGASPSPSFSFTSNPKPGSGTGTPPAPPPPRRRGTPSQQQQTPPLQRRTTNSSTLGNGNGNENGGDNPLTNTAEDIGATVLTGHGIQATGNGGQGQQGQEYNKKLELWYRRLARAHEVLDEQGVPLYTWRKGEDVIKEAEGIVREALREMGLNGKGKK